MINESITNKKIKKKYIINHIKYTFLLQDEPSLA